MQIHKKLFPIILIALTIAISGRLFSQELTLEDAWDIARKNNLTLKQVEKTIRQAEEEIKIQRSDFLPSINASAAYNYQSEIAEFQLPFQIPGQGVVDIEAGIKNQYDLNVSLRQPLFTGFRTYNLVKAAQEQLHARIAAKESSENQLLLRIGQLYYAIQSNALQQEIISRSIQRANNQLTKVRNLLAADQAIPFDTLEIANRKLQQQIQLKNLENVHQIQLSQFDYLLKIDSTIALRKIPAESISLALDGPENYKTTALQRRPELAQYNSIKKAQSNQLKVVRSALFPQVYASASYHYARPGVNFFRDEWMDYYMVGVNLQWSLWNWGKNYRKIKQARYEFEQADLQYRDLLDQIDQQVEETYRRLENIREQIDLQRKLVAQERKRYQLTEDQYSQAQVTSLDLSDAEQKLTEAELMLKDKYMEWYQYRLQMDYVTGVIGKQLR